MKDLRAIRGGRIVSEWVAEGEHEHQDFKFAISDARKIARSISAFANNSGGRLLIGVKDNGVIAGVRNEEDIYVVEQAAERYCRPAQQVAFSAYRMPDGAHVIVADIAAATNKPVCVVEERNTLKAYYRVADENIAAHPLMVRAWQIAAGSCAASLGERHYALAALFGSDSCTDSRQAAMALHIPLAVADEMIAQLAAAGILTFVFDGSFFKIVAEK